MQESYPNNTQLFSDAEEFKSALTVNPELLQETLKKLILRKGKHYKARALRTKARIEKRKAKRKS